MTTTLDSTLVEEGAPAFAAAGAVEASILRIRAGEVEAFGDLMALIEGKVLAVAWRMLGDREPARDAAQEIYLRIYRSLDRFRLGEDFHGWCYRITVNVCLDHLKARGPASPELQEVPDPHHADPSEAILLDQQRALVRQALGCLTPAERAALVLRDLEGLSTEAVAQALGVRPVTVRSQVSSARSKIQSFCSRFLKGGVR